MLGRSQRRGEEHPFEMREPARAPDKRAHQGRRNGRLRRARPSPQARTHADPASDRNGIPAFQPVPTSHGGRKRHSRPDRRPRNRAARGARASDSEPREGGCSRDGSWPIRRSSPAVSGNGSELREPLALRPAALLFDEPTSSLDPELAGEVLDVMRELAREGMTMIIATHELEFARELADRVLFMDAGRIAEQGDAELVLVNPRHERTRTFLKRFHEFEEPHAQYPRRLASDIRPTGSSCPRRSKPGSPSTFRGALPEEISDD